jgi:flagellar basal-body rod protein FlgB
MNTENTIDAVRLALNLHELRARTASVNVANANTPGATETRMDFAKVEAALREVVAAGDEVDAARWLAAASAELEATTAQNSAAPIQLDEQIAVLAAAGVDYHALTEALNRQFGLMRIAIAGRI